MYQASPKQQHQVQQSREEQFRESFRGETEAKARAQKPTDRNIPDGIEDLIVGNGVQEYKRLREVERRLDATMTRKRLELQEQRLRSMHHTRKLRIWISNTAENQPWQGKELDENAFDFNSGSEATYKVQIVGKLLEDEEDSIVQEMEKNTNGATSHSEEAQDGRDISSQKAVEATVPKPHFSHFFKSITVELDRAKALQQDASNMMEWKKPPLAPNAQPPPASADFDSLQFERKSDENINCTINLYRDEKPDRFAMSRELSEIVEGEDATREQIMTAIWMYIKAQGLQRDEEKRLIQCDDALRAVRTTIFCLPSAMLILSRRSSKQIRSTSLRSTKPSCITYFPYLQSSFLIPYESIQSTKQIRRLQSTMCLSSLATLFKRRLFPSSRRIPNMSRRCAPSTIWTPKLPWLCKLSTMQRRAIPSSPA